MTSYDYDQTNAPSGTFTDVSSSLSYSCAIDSDSAIHCWGWDYNNQISGVPDGDFAQISAGYYHACAIDTTGSIHCWGDDTYDQVTNRPAGTFVQVSSGEYHSCAIDTDGAITCWGSGSFSETTVPELYSTCDSSLDADCDGVATANDCDDTNPAVLELSFFYGYNGAVYRYCEGEASFYDAENICNNIGLHLTYMENTEANTLLTNYIIENHSASDWWIGIDDPDSDGTWDYPHFNGNLFNYLNWGDGMPTSTDGHECGAMDTSGSWFNDDCSSLKAFVCR